MRITPTILVLAPAWAIVPGTASAHAMLETARPAVGSTLASSPTELELDFSEGLEPRFSKVVVTDQAGASMNAGALHTEAGNASHLLVPVGRLAPGQYTVTWHAVSVDTHKTEGAYHFTITP